MKRITPSSLVPNTAIAICISLSLLTASAATANHAGPHILWFVVDDMSAHFSCYGESLIKTPHVDRLVAEGLQFTNAFVTAPVCSSSRSALITGYYQTSLGAHHHRSGRGSEKIHLPAGVTPIPELFQRAGYYTCTGSGLDSAPAGESSAWQLSAGERAPGGKTDYNFEWDPSIYDGHDWSGRRTGQPFFMQVQLLGGKLRGNTTESVRRLARRAESSFGASVHPEQVTLPPYYPRDPVLLEDWAAYLDCVRFTDQHVGQVIQRLEREGLLDQTLIVFMTDHGISHARGKQFLYNEGTHIPLVLRGPGIPSGTVRDDLVEHIDVAAMSLSAAGITLPVGMHARDPLNANYQRREAVFAARDRCDETVERIRSVRTRRFLYIRNFHPRRPHLQPNAYKDGKSIVRQLRMLHAAGQLSPLTEELLFRPTRPAEELYDWVADEWQLRDLARLPEHQATLEELRQRLDRWIEETRDQGAESDAMYDSDMRVYLSAGNPVLPANIEVMRRWASEGK